MKPENYTGREDTHDVIQQSQGSQWKMLSQYKFFYFFILLTFRSLQGWGFHHFLYCIFL